MRWAATDELNALIRRYYTGEAALWAEIRARVDDELRRRGVARGAFHIRLLRREDGGYDVQVEGADEYRAEP